MASRFAVLTVRPAGKQSLAEWPEDQDAPTGYWISILAATTPVADLMWWAKARWQIEHYYRELKHGLGQDHFEDRTWRGWHHHVTLVTAVQAFLALGRLDAKTPHTGLPLYQVLDVLQDLLRCWIGACTTCGRPLPNPRSRRRQPRT